MEGCHRDKDGNVIGPISHDIVPPERIIKIAGGNSVTCFDIDSLARNVFVNDSYLNPLTRKKFPNAIIAKIDDYIRCTKYVLRTQGREIGVVQHTRLADLPSILIKNLLNTDRTAIYLYDFFLTAGGLSTSVYAFNLSLTMESVSPTSVSVAMFKSRTDRQRKLHKLAKALTSFDERKMLLDGLPGFWIAPNDVDSYTFEREEWKGFDVATHSSARLGAIPILKTSQSTQIHPDNSNTSSCKLKSASAPTGSLHRSNNRLPRVGRTSSDPQTPHRRNSPMRNLDVDHESIRLPIPGSRDKRRLELSIRLPINEKDSSNVGRYR